MHPDAYSDAENELLRELWLAGTPDNVIADRLNRGRSSVRMRAAKLGLPCLRLVRHRIKQAQSETALNP